MSKWYLITYQREGDFSVNQLVTDKPPVTWQGSTITGNMFLAALELTPNEARFFVEQYGRELDGVLESDQSNNQIYHPEEMT